MKLENVSHVYHNSNDTNATGLRALSLTFGKNDLTFIKGSSGSGKTTLLEILAGIITPTGGSMFVNGVDTAYFGKKGMDGYRTNYVGIVFQDNHLLPHLTLAQNVALAKEIQGKTASKAEISELFEKLGISGLEGRYPSEVSGGQQQRCSIARTLIKKPRILFADELTSSLDPENRNEIYKILKDLSKEIPVIATSHAEEMIEQFADRVITIKDGKLVSDTKPPKPQTIASQDPQFQYERTALPTKRIFGLAWLNLSSSKLKTLLTVFLAIFSITFLAITANLATLTTNRAVVYSFHQSDQPYITLTSRDRFFNPNWLRSQAGFYSSVAPVSQIGSSPISIIHVGGHDHQMFGITRLAVLNPNHDSGSPNIFGQTLVAGVWPSGQNINQVVISDFVATQLVQAKGLDSFDYLIGETVTFNPGNLTYTIIGIYQTNFSDFFDSDQEEFLLKTQLTSPQITQALYLLQNNWTTAFTATDVISRIVTGTSEIHYGHSGQITLGGPNNSTAHQFFLTDLMSGTRPAAGQVAPLYNIIRNQGLTIQRGGPNQFDARVSAQVATALGITSALNFAVSREIRDNTHYFEDLHPNITVPQSNIVHQRLYTFTDIGFEPDPDLPGNLIVLPPTVYNQLMRTLVVPSQSVLVARDYSPTSMLRIIDNIGGDVTATYKDSTSIGTFMQRFETAIIVMLVFGVLLGFLTVFMVLSFIILGLKARKSDIKILRKLGAKRIDVFWIFLLEGAVFALVATLGVLLFTFLSSLVINFAIASSLGHAITIVITNPLFWTVLPFSVMLFIVLGYSLPTLRTIRD